ncbi:hypothetical protein [Streptomyces goshikiensis]|uniref:hypothetical protein n=1 Tax=Streptomyces goshikiensis TaxID=1942 RepID=UPI0036C4D909
MPQLGRGHRGQKPDYRFDWASLDAYGFRCEATGEEAEAGPRVRVTALLDPRPISIVVTAPRREVYEEFWADLLANPPLEMLRCRS